MHSKKLQAAGLHNKIGGRDYNFRDQQGQVAVESNLLRLTQEVSDKTSGIVYADQVHEDTVTYVTSQSLPQQIQRIEASDGLLTDELGLALVIKFADCTPVVIYDPVKKVQATVHSGWRSTVKEISRKAIEAMQEKFACQLEDLLIYIGPTIDQMSYEVGPEVYEAFAPVGNREAYFISSSNPGKYLLNMLQANLYILEKVGIKASQIEYARESTFTCPDLHSARRDRPDYGLNAMVTVMV